MKNILLAFVTLSAVAAMGQSNPQKDCFEQAKKVAREYQVFINHYDTKTQTCWVRVQSEWDDPFDKQRHMETFVWNAYEARSTAMYLCRAVGDHTVTDSCEVDGIECSSYGEFSKLLKQHYPWLL